MNQRRITAKRDKMQFGQAGHSETAKGKYKRKYGKNKLTDEKINLRKTADKTASSPRTKATEKRQTKAAAKSGIRLREPP